MRVSSVINVGGKAVVLEEFINSLMKRKNTALNNPAKENVKVVANEDTMLRKQMFPRLPVRATLVADTKFCVRDTKSVSDFCQKHFVSATNVSPFARHGHTTNVLCPARLPTSFFFLSATMCPRLPPP